MCFWTTSILNAQTGVIVCLVLYIIYGKLRK
jgi:hypothetical protein